MHMRPQRTCEGIGSTPTSAALEARTVTSEYIVTVAVGSKFSVTMAVSDFMANLKETRRESWPNVYVLPCLAAYGFNLDAVDLCHEGVAVDGYRSVIRMEPTDESAGTLPGRGSPCIASIIEKPIVLGTLSFTGSHSDSIVKHDA